MISSTNLNKDFTSLPTVYSHNDLSNGGITPVKVMRAVTYSFSLLSSIGTALSIYSRSELAPWISAVTGVLCWSAYYAYNAKDYKNPQEVHKMRQEALFQDFLTLMNDHGLKNIRKHNLLTQDVLEHKFIIECSQSSMHNVLKACPLTTIFETNAFSREFLSNVFMKELTSSKLQNIGLDRLLSEMNNFKSLANELFNLGLIDHNILSEIVCYCTVLTQYSSQKVSDLKSLDSKYPGRITRLLISLDEEKIKAKQEAEQIKNKIISDGTAAVKSAADFHTILDSIFTNKSDEKLFFDNLNEKCTGCSSIQETAKSVSQKFYAQKLIEIDAQKKFVISNNIGADIQALYDQEFSMINSSFDRLSSDSHKVFLTKIQK